MIEINDAYYTTLRELYRERGRLKEIQTYYSKGLAVIEKEQMKAADEDFRNAAQTKTRLSVQLQTRDARASNPYKRAIKALASAEHRLCIVEGEIEIMDKQFQQYRTVEASRRAYG